MITRRRAMQNLGAATIAAVALPAVARADKGSGTTDAKAAGRGPMFKPSKFSKGPLDISKNEYGAFKLAPKAPAIGDVLPDFKLPRARGGELSLAEAAKNGPALIMLYRGHW